MNLPGGVRRMIPAVVLLGVGVLGGAGIVVLGNGDGGTKKTQFAESELSSSTTTTTAPATTTTAAPPSSTTVTAAAVVATTTAPVNPLMTYCIMQAKALYARYPAQSAGRDAKARCELILTNKDYPVVDRAGINERIRAAEAEFQLAASLVVTPSTTAITTAASPVTTTTFRRIYCSAFYTIDGQTGPLSGGKFEDRVYAVNGSISSSACVPASANSGGTWVPKDPSWIWAGAHCC